MSVALILVIAAAVYSRQALAGQGSVCQLTFSSDNLDTGTFNITQLLSPGDGLECRISLKNTKRDGFTQLSFQFKQIQPRAQITRRCNTSVLSVYGSDYEIQPQTRSLYRLARYCDGVTDIIFTSYRYVVMEVKRLHESENMFLSGMCTFSSTTPGKHLPDVSHGQRCGQRLLTGLSGSLSSPASSASSDLSPVECSWTIMVPPKQNVLLTLTELNIGVRDGWCFEEGAYLSIYNGLTDISRSPDIRFCGRLENLPDEEKILVSTNNWINVRYVSSGQQSHFKASWTAIIAPSPNYPCRNDSHLVTCQTIVPCTSTSQGACWPGSEDYFCIDSSLQCDGRHDCGPYSNADEINCQSTTVILIAVLLPTAVLSFGLVVVVARCAYKRSLQRYATSSGGGVGCRDCNESAAARRHFRLSTARRSRKPWLRLEAARKSESATPLSGLASSCSGGVSGGASWSPAEEEGGRFGAAGGSRRQAHSIWTSEATVS